MGRRTEIFGGFIATARTFRCSLNYAKHSFFGAVNGLFEKLLNLASAKCMPILIYGLESCQLSNADLRSLDFTFNGLFMKFLRQRAMIALMLLKLANLSLAQRFLVVF